MTWTIGQEVGRAIGAGAKKTIHKGVVKSVTPSGVASVVFERPDRYPSNHVFEFKDNGVSKYGRASGSIFAWTEEHAVEFKRQRIIADARADVHARLKKQRDAKKAEDLAAINECISSLEKRLARKYQASTPTATMKRGLELIRGFRDGIEGDN